jgi:hypothetical protein
MRAWSSDLVKGDFALPESVDGWRFCAWTHQLGAPPRWYGGSTHAARTGQASSPWVTFTKAGPGWIPRITQVFSGFEPVPASGGAAEQ